jgi:hypothetical protein
MSVDRRRKRLFAEGLRRLQHMFAVVRHSCLSTACMRLVLHVYCHDAMIADATVCQSTGSSFVLDGTFTKQIMF